MHLVRTSKRDLRIFMASLLGKGWAATLATIELTIKVQIMQAFPQPAVNAFQHVRNHPPSLFHSARAMIMVCNWHK